MSSSSKHLSSSAFWWSSKHHQILHHEEELEQDTMECSSSSKRAFNFDLNGGDDEEQLSGSRAVPKDHLFEKPLTPSDVGKLNRLVIPKQNAEKYFPLTGKDSSTAAADKGLLLTFEDDSGKLWRFRYSYWNSSQSYVLTKGWSRFVKEKRLDAGDVVLFLRHRLDGDRFFIGWRRRSGSAGGTAAAAGVREEGMGAVVGGGWGQGYYPYQLPADLPYQSDCFHHVAAGSSSTAECQTPTSGNSKTLRLFGVNMECGQAAESVTPDGSTTLTPAQTGHHYLYQYYSNPIASYNNHYTHMQQDLGYSNLMRYQQG
ncbi:unnamed protein product [Cuscuta europaea]|uniref:TF-B3 domain-containing protein n=1 Tax=Cuscuta europaea TaxID=41803 RepID=A0A9P1EP51_CUSEU|nr:unnamed protein product [Cuscuta europaea]